MKSVFYNIVANGVHDRLTLRGFWCKISKIIEWFIMTDFFKGVKWNNMQ